MVHILSVAAVLLAAVANVNAAAACQCLFNDGSHCCVQVFCQMQHGQSLDCTAACTGAVRNSDQTPCNAGGKNSGICECVLFGYVFFALMSCFQLRAFRSSTW
ncbi:hypothetical protein EJ04DRAFT_551853 [Polyplosphaeria fusca]|uniref:Uncharacterized protein n=1 Tax=Polyplosphaeria fusca TaxID=682080 RepID=A0A9P4V2K0_9PLEO|nr:hypothetical protein EJ04DRAFT_551853 [Polyplosphaeria fusca]